MLHVLSLKAQSWVTIDSGLQQQSPIIEILESNAEQYKFKVRIPGFYKEHIYNQGTMYEYLSFDRYGSLSQVGKPALPIITQLIGLPSYGEKCDVSIESPMWVNIEIGKVYPFQRPLKEAEKREVFDVSSEIYNSVSYEPELINIGEVMSYRGMKNAVLQICPFKYFPTGNKLSVMREFIVNVSFDRTDSRRNTTASIFGIENFTRIIANYNTDLMSTYNTALARDVQRANNDSYDYLIIGNDTALLNSDVLSDFCLWKAFKGHKCKVVSTETIGEKSEDIKEYIKSEYSKGLQYVLFIGDVDDIPVCSGSVDYDFFAGDYLYGCIDGENDVQADISIGRFSANSVEELTNMINKTITYEDSVIISGNNNSILMVAHKEEAPGKYQGCLEDICNLPYLRHYAFVKAYGSETSLGGNCATNTDVINAINSGVGIVNYRGHGFETGWDSGWSYNNVSFKNSHVDMLDNTLYPIVFSIACLNGNIETDECLLEAFTRSPKGAVGVLGSFYSSYTEANHTYNKLLFETLFDDGIYNIGNLCNIAHIKNITERNDFDAVYNALISLWGGDPSLEVWTEATYSFNSMSINKTDDVLTFNTGHIRDYVIRVVSEDGILMGEYTSENPEYSLTVPNEPCYIVLDKDNYVPYIYPVLSTFIQNVTINKDTSVSGYNVIIGKDVTCTKPYGDVIVNKNAKMTVDAFSDVKIKNGFKVLKGGELLIK